MSPVDRITSAGPFTAKQLLGSNGTTATWKGSSVEGEDVAIVAIAKERVAHKHLWPAAQEALSKVQDAAEGTRVVRPLAWGEEDDFFWAAYEWMDGSHIGAIIQQDGLPDAARTFAIASQIMEALLVLEQADVCHRVITPASIFVTSGDEVLLLHAGWSTILLAAEGGPAHDALISNLPFLAPEVAGNFPSQERAADVFALGANIYFFLTGQPIHWTDDPQQLAQVIASTPPDMEPLRQVLDGEALELVEEMLELDPDERPVNLAALHDRLRHAAETIRHAQQQAAAEEERRGAPAIVAEGDHGAASPPPLPDHGGEALPPPQPNAVDPGPAHTPPEETSTRLTAHQAAMAAGLGDPSKAPSSDALRRGQLTPAPPVAASSKSGGKKLLIVLVGLVGALVLLCGIVWAMMTLLAGGVEQQLTEQVERVTREIEQAPERAPDAPRGDDAYRLTQERLLEVGRLHRNYLRDYGIWARRLDDLRAENLPEELFEDAWGKAFDVRDSYIVSAGANGRWDDADDVWFDADARELGGRVVAAQEPETDDPPPADAEEAGGQEADGTEAQEAD